MTRTKPSNGSGPDLEDDELYRGVLVRAKKIRSKIEGYADQIEVEWELKQGAKLRDWPSVAVGMQRDGTIAKLRQMLNALGERDKGEELWFDADTLEWGYDLDGDDTTPAYAKLTPGMVVMFRGENVLKPTADNPKRSVYKITSYRSAAAKAKK